MKLKQYSDDAPRPDFAALARQYPFLAPQSAPLHEPHTTNTPINHAFFFSLSC